MKRLITLIVIAFSAVVAQAQTAATDIKVAGTPVETLVLKETEFNFGKIPQGKPVTHVFEITNTGKDSLHIVNVQASCGCTTPEWERNKPVAPGATAKITVGYNAAAEGTFTKPVTITYNGSEIKQLFIKGEVWKTPTSSAPENRIIKDL